MLHFCRHFHLIRGVSIVPRSGPRTVRRYSDEPAGLAAASPALLPEIVALVAGDAV